MATQLAWENPISELGVKLISSDNHVNEPRDLFTSRVAIKMVSGMKPDDARKVLSENAARVFGFAV